MPTAIEREDSWLSRFRERRPLRRYGALRLYRAFDAASAQGSACGVLVSVADADPALADAQLARLVSAHTRAAHPCLAPLEGPVRAGELSYAVIRAPIATDLDRLLARVARGKAAEGGIAALAGLAVALLSAAAAAELAGERMVRSGLSALLLDDAGRPYWLGLGDALFDTPSALCLSPAESSDGASAELALIGQFLKRSRRFFVGGHSSEGADGAQTTRLHDAMTTLQRRLSSADKSERLASAARALELLKRGFLSFEPEPALAPFSRFAARLTADSESELREPSGHGERYRFLERLGEGGTSTVFRAYDRQLGEHVAIKLLSVSDRAEDTERLLREVRLLRTVHHPHVVRGYELYEDRGSVGAVMEYIAGHTLARLLTGPLESSRLFQALAEVADGLASLHRVGVLHRDVKPENIVLSPERGAVLVDLGFARGSRSEHTLTRTGQALTDPLYQAPELARGEPASAASDVYALARIALCIAGSHETADNLSARLAQLPGHPALRTILARALHDDPRARCSARELEGELARAAAAAPFAEAARFTVQSDGSGFCNAAGEAVDLGRHAAQLRLLRALATSLLERPGQPVARAALIDAGWPGQRIAQEAADNRLNVAIAQLRRLGLREVLWHREDGYLLDPARVTVLSLR